MINSISPLLIVLGPTASGKSTLAMHLSQVFDGEIVNCDSLQIYRGMDIGTAKPSTHDRQTLPHHLYDVRDPDQVFTAGEYARLARPILEEISLRGRLPVITGGAGFYLRALLEGLSPAPTRSDDIRQRLERIEARRPGSLHRIFNCWDSAASARIHPRDIHKLVRAIEIILIAQTPLAKAHEAKKNVLEGYSVLKIGLAPPREELRPQLRLRTQLMFDQGLLAEVATLRAAGYGKDAKAMECVGYKQAQAVLDGIISPEAAQEDTFIRTSQYAKRQMTWFRRDSDIQWLHGFGSDPAVQARAESLLKQFLLTVINFSSH